MSSDPSLEPLVVAAPIEVRTVGASVVEEVVRELRRLSHAAALDLAIAVGRLIVERFYAGRIDVWRLRGKRCPSFRKLAARTDLPLSAASLYRAVAIYEVWQRVSDVATWKHVGACHVRAVLSLPPTDQEVALRRAEANGWTVRQLEHCVSELRTVGADSRGRPRQAPTIKAMRDCERSMDVLARSLEAEELGSLERHALEELKSRLTRLRVNCDRTIAVLAGACTVDQCPPSVGSPAALRRDCVAKINPNVANESPSSCRIVNS